MDLVANLKLLVKGTNYNQARSNEHYHGDEDGDDDDTDGGSCGRSWGEAIDFSLLSYIAPMEQCKSIVHHWNSAPYKLYWSIGKVHHASYIAPLVKRTIEALLQNC